MAASLPAGGVVSPGARQSGTDTVVWLGGPSSWRWKLASDAVLLPMLASPGSVDEVRTGFAYEFKWDGVRAIADLGAGWLRLWSRRGTEITDRYPELASLADALPGGALLDGEIVALGQNSRPSFERLQRRMHVADPAAAARAAERDPVVYLVFDLLRLGDRLLLDQPYEERRRLLLDLALAGDHWQTPAHHLDGLDVLLGVAGNLGLEGLVAKRLGSSYQPGRRSRDWRKLRLLRRQEFVVGGWSVGEGWRSASFGALLVGCYDEPGGRLRYAGNVGTGFADAEVDRLRRALEPLRRDTSPFADPVPGSGNAWVDPELVVEVAFREWTAEGRLRQPAYKSLREDRDPRDVVREPEA